MVEIIDLSNVIIDGRSQDIVSAIANNLQGDLQGILTALTTYEQQLQAATPAIETVDTGQIADLEQQLTEAQDTIADLQHQLAQLIINDWPKLVADLRDAGFYNYLTAAQAVNPDLLDNVVDLRNAADRADRIGVITQYLTIAQQYPPTATQAQTWQAVLEAQNPPIPPHLLRFVD